MAAIIGDGNRAHKHIQRARIILRSADRLPVSEAADAQDDAEHGAARRGDEMPDWVKDKDERLGKIRQAKAAMVSGAGCRSRPCANG